MCVCVCAPAVLRTVPDGHEKGAIKCDVRGGGSFWADSDFSISRNIESNCEWRSQTSAHARSDK